MVKANWGELSADEGRLRAADQANQDAMLAWWQDPAARLRPEEPLLGLLARHADLLGLLKQAAAQPHVTWPASADVLHPAENDLAPLLELLRLSLVDAYSRCGAGQPGEAMDDLDTILQVSNQFSQLHTLRGLILEDASAQLVCDALPDLLGRLDAGDAAFARLRGLLAGGSDPAGLKARVLYDRAFNHTVYEDMVTCRATLDALAGGPNNVRWTTHLYYWVRGPQIDASQAYNLQCYAELLTVLGQPYDKMAGRLAELENRWISQASGPAKIVRLWGTDNMLQRVLPEIKISAMTLALRRMGIVALAVRQYQLQHGRLPGKLADLQPDFLADLPADPVTGGPLGYLPESQPPRLYSVGLDRADNAGAFDEKDDPFGIKGHDAVFLLPAPPPPATQPASQPGHG